MSAGRSNSRARSSESVFAKSDDGHDDDTESTFSLGIDTVSTLDLGASSNHGQHRDHHPHLDLDLDLDGADVQLEETATGTALRRMMSRLQETPSRIAADVDGDEDDGAVQTMSSPALLKQAMEAVSIYGSNNNSQKDDDDDEDTFSDFSPARRDVSPLAGLFDDLERPHPHHHHGDAASTSSALTTAPKTLVDVAVRRIATAENLRRLTSASAPNSASASGTLNPSSSSSSLITADEWFTSAAFVVPSHRSVNNITAGDVDDAFSPAPRNSSRASVAASSSSSSSSSSRDGSPSYVALLTRANTLPHQQMAAVATAINSGATEEELARSESTARSVIGACAMQAFDTMASVFEMVPVPAFSAAALEREECSVRQVIVDAAESESQLILGMLQSMAAAVARMPAATTSVVKTRLGMARLLSEQLVTSSSSSSSASSSSAATSRESSHSRPSTVSTTVAHTINGILPSPTAADDATALSNKAAVVAAPAPPSTARTGSAAPAFRAWRVVP